LPTLSEAVLKRVKPGSQETVPWMSCANVPQPVRLCDTSELSSKYRIAPVNFTVPPLNGTADSSMIVLKGLSALTIAIRGLSGVKNAMAVRIRIIVTIRFFGSMFTPA
jgi:hypothetical protein